MLFERLRDPPRPVLLHSSDRARYDVMAADPLRLVVYQDGVLKVGSASTRTDRPFDALPLLFGLNRVAPAAHCRKGFIGYFGYGLQHTLERLSPGPTDVAGLPLICGGDCSWSVVTDHATLVGFQPAPFAAYLATPYGDVVSLSPERLSGKSARTSRRRRSREPHHDIATRIVIRHRVNCDAAEKDRAENVEGGVYGRLDQGLGASSCCNAVVAFRARKLRILRRDGGRTFIEESRDRPDRASECRCTNLRPPALDNATIETP